MFRAMLVVLLFIHWLELLLKVHVNYTVIMKIVFMQVDEMNNSVSAKNTELISLKQSFLISKT